jgi:predicted NBD/HSP70 family sugar kinase
VASGPKQDFFDTSAQRMDVSSLRRNNERAVLTSVARNPGQSAAQLSRSTGLGQQSIAGMLVEMEQAGLVMRGEVVRGLRGQPATPMYLAPDGVFVIGCEIGWRHYHILIRNFTGQILGEHRRDYAFPDIDTVFQEIGSLARQLVEFVPADRRNRVLGMGVATPSGLGRNIDLTGGSQDHARRWRELDITSAAEEASGMTVFGFKDGSAACWSELAAYPPPRPANLAYFYVGTAISAGLVAQGRLWEGPTGNSANLGSMLVTGRDGQKVLAHRIASIAALESDLSAAGMTVPQGNPEHWDWDLLEPIASQWLDNSAMALAQVIFNIQSVAEFSVALVDGVMPRPIVERLVQKAREEIKALPIPPSDRPEVEMGRLGAAAAARGAALKPIFRRYFSAEPADLK